jgi:hypothetical protein
MLPPHWYSDPSIEVEPPSEVEAGAFASAIPEAGQREARLRYNRAAVRRDQRGQSYQVGEQACQMWR